LCVDSETLAQDILRYAISHVSKLGHSPPPDTRKHIRTHAHLNTYSLSPRATYTHTNRYLSPPPSGAPCPPCSPAAPSRAGSDPIRSSRAAHTILIAHAIQDRSPAALPKQVLVEGRRAPHHPQVLSNFVEGVLVELLILVACFDCLPEILAIPAMCTLTLRAVMCSS
jgi:hypothetical protein